METSEARRNNDLLRACQESRFDFLQSARYVFIVDESDFDACSMERETYVLSRADFYNIVWPYALQGCCLNRDTARTFREAGDWAKVDIQFSAAEDAWLAIPHISGRLTKAS